MFDLAGSARLPVVLDTDLGTDVDDLLALLLLAGEPRVDLRAVTTVYGDVALRARLARRVLRLLGRDEVPVHAGCRQPQSGREVWWTGLEGRGVTGLPEERFSPVGAVEALIQAAGRDPGQLIVVAVGPLTNLAEALDRNPGWAAAVRGLVVMGGEFARGVPEHNTRADAVAAQKVLSAGIPVRYVGLDVTTTVWFDAADLAEVTAGGGRLADLLVAQVRQWWEYLGEPRCHPHDPLAVLALLEPELFTLRLGRWRVVDAGEQLGALAPAQDGPAIEYAGGVEPATARASIRSRLSTAVAR